jgi:hypothetical protein
MAPTLVLSVGLAIDGTPNSLYLGNDYSAAEAAAATAGATGTYPLVRVYRNLTPYREYQFPPA